MKNNFIKNVKNVRFLLFLPCKLFMKNMEQSLDFIYGHFSDIEKDDMEYIYRGEITPVIVMDILDFAKSNLAKAEDTKKLKTRIYYIMGEGLQNITRHQADNVDENVDKEAIIAIIKKRHKYIIATGNLMFKAEEDALRKKLEKINHMDSDGLREFSKEIRNNMQLSAKGGASLGLIEMAKRSGNKLDYLIKPVDDKLSYFYLTTEIKTSEEPEPENAPEVYSVKQLIDNHENFNKNNYIISFKGDFNQENLLSLLAILKSGMSETPTRIKLYSVMVELLQNIVKHADNLDHADDWKAGVFFIKELEDSFSLLAGNYIRKVNSAALKERIDRLNNMSYKELTKEYNSILLNTEINDSVSTGLGFIDIRRKTGNQIEYSLKEVNNEIDFFIVKTIVNKKN